MPSTRPGGTIEGMKRKGRRVALWTIGVGVGHDYNWRVEPRTLVTVSPEQMELEPLKKGKPFEPGLHEEFWSRDKLEERFEGEGGLGAPPEMTITPRNASERFPWAPVVFFGALAYLLMRKS